MSDVISLFPDITFPCTKGRRYSTDRNGRYVLQCRHAAGHAGPCDHRWQTDLGPETAA